MMVQHAAGTYATLPLRARSVLALLPPYPIVLVSTKTNIITINQISYFTFDPLRLGIAVAHSRHTYDLLREERAFVVNVPDVNLLDAVKLCGSVSGRGTDKFVAADLTVVPAQEIPASTIAECGAHIECRVDREIAFEHRTWFVGSVVAARCREDFEGVQALLCGREAYSAVGPIVAPR